MPVGRKPKPAHLRAIEGNLGKRPPRGDAVDIPAPSRPLRPPAKLSGPALAEWRRVEPHLRAHGLVAEPDAAALAFLCMVYGLGARAQAELDEKQDRPDGPKGATTYETITESGSVMERERPQVKIVLQAAKAYWSGAAEFGLTPSARARLALPQRKAADPWEARLAARAKAKD